MADRWLTFDEMCEELRVPPEIVRLLIRNHRLVGIGLPDKKPGSPRDWRLLDPIPAYKAALQTQYAVLSRSHSVNLLEKPVLSSAEVAEIAGVSEQIIRNAVYQKKIRPYKIKHYSLFTVEEVRRYLLARERKQPYDRRARCEAIIRWAFAQLDKYPGKILTQADVHRDDQLEGALRRLMRLPKSQRPSAVAEFWRRFELANTVVQTIQKSTS